MADARSAVGIARDVTAVARERQISVTSAGLAYHAFNTLVPLVVLLLVGVSVVDSLEYVREAFAGATGFETAGGELDEVADGNGDRLRATGLALVIFAWSAVRLFRAVDSAFTDVYGSRKNQSLVASAVDVALLVVTVAVGVALVGVVGVALALLVDGVGFSLLSPFVLVSLLVVTFLPMYYLLPQADVSIREALPGTAVAAVSWTLLAIGFRSYVAASETVALFGLAGAVLLLLTWVYLGGLCLLLGAILNAVLADRVDPEEEWAPMADVWSRYA